RLLYEKRTPESCKLAPTSLPTQLAHGRVETLQRLADVGQSHGGAEAVMAGRPAVVVEVDAPADGRGDEAEHGVALVPHRVAVAGRLAGQAEVDAEARPQSLDVGGDAVPLEHVVEPLVQ